MPSPRDLRGRYVKKEFWLDYEVHTELTLEERLTYIGLWSYADDGGWIYWQPRAAAAAIYRYMDAAEAVALVQRTVDRLVAMKKARLLRCGHLVLSSMEHNLTMGQRAYPVRDEHNLACLKSRRKTNRDDSRRLKSSSSPSPSPLLSPSPSGSLSTDDLQSSLPARARGENGLSTFKEAMAAAGVTPEVVKSLAHRKADEAP